MCSFLCLHIRVVSFISRLRERELSSSELQHPVAKPNDTPSEARLCPASERDHWMQVTRPFWLSHRLVFVCQVLFFSSLFHDVRNDKRSIPHKKRKEKKDLAVRRLLSCHLPKKKRLVLCKCVRAVFFSSISLWSLGFFIPIVSNMIDMLNCV